MMRAGKAEECNTDMSRRAFEHNFHLTPLSIALGADHDQELITSDVKISDSLSKIGSLVGFGASHYFGLIYHSLVHIN